MTKEGIDRVVVSHFDRVFKQNPIPKGTIWVRYWKLIDEVFELLDKRNDDMKNYEFPTLEEVRNIIWARRLYWEL